LVKFAFEKDEEKRKTLAASFFSETLPKWAAIIDKRL